MYRAYRVGVLEHCGVDVVVTNERAHDQVHCVVIHSISTKDLTAWIESMNQKVHHQEHCISMRVGFAFSMLEDTALSHTRTYHGIV